MLCARTFQHLLRVGPPTVAVILVVAGCATAPPVIPDLLCIAKAGAESSADCTGVPTLLGGELRLSRRGTFQLTGHYAACFQVEDLRIDGTFHAVPHDGGVDLELLAKRTRGGAPEARKLQRTIGLVNLDTKTLQARFTDTAALIRSRGQMKGAAPSVAMACSKN